MSEKHSLIVALEDAEIDSTRDYQLLMISESYMSLFTREENKNSRQARLDTIKTVDLQRSPLFEAIKLFAESRIEKDFSKGIGAAEKFEQMEKLSLEKNWFWMLVYSLEAAAYIYKTYNQVSRLKVISSRVAGYLLTKKETVPTITVFVLLNFSKTCFCVLKKLMFKKYEKSQ